MKILYLAHRYDYGQRERGHSFEHCNFYDALVRMGHDVIYFDFAELAETRGRAWMNNRLREVVATHRPDAMFAVLFKDYLDPEVIESISRRGETVTINWFCDDHWRWESFARPWAEKFNWVVTTAECAVPKYRQLGIRNVIKSQWGCNHFLYRRLGVPLAYDVSFVGLPHGSRREVINTLRSEGINVQAWGMGWENGRLSQDGMIDVFNRSRINLNFAEASVSSERRRRLRDMTHKYFTRPLHAVPGGWRVANAGGAIVNSALAVAGLDEASSLPRQIKGRNFEVPGCGGFILTNDAENLTDYYGAEREIGLYEGLGGLIETVRYYLDHEDERAAVAQAGYERTLAEHTYVHRFNEIFERAGLPNLPLESSLSGAHPGATEDVT